MSSKDDVQQQVDEDILRCKEEILRLKSVVPPFGQPPKHNSTAVHEKKIKSVIASEAPSPVTAKNSDKEIQPYSAGAFSDTAAFYAPRGDVFAQGDFTLPTEKIDETAGLEAKLQETDGDECELEQEIDETAENEPKSNDDSEIPGFDLAQQIMAAQRKISGDRRKGPGSPRIPIKEEKPVSPTVKASPTSKVRLSHAGHIAAPMSPQQRVIAEIVSRDIKKFYQGGNFRK